MDLSTVQPFDVVDFGGATIGSIRWRPPRGVHVTNAHVDGTVTLIDAVDVTVSHLTVTPPADVPVKGGIVMLGGRGWAVEDCVVEGGRCAGQYSVGLSPSMPADWRISRCTGTGNGLWGIYPQAHAVYVLLDPSFDTNGLIEDCLFTQPGVGATVKLGGTGNWPWTEGTRGVTVERCVIGAEPGPDGRCQTILTQGYRTDVGFRDCELQGEKAMVTVADGARTRLEGCSIPANGVQDVRYYRFLIFPARDKRTVAANIGGLSWDRCTLVAP